MKLSQANYNKLANGLTSIYKESNGWWIELKEEYICPSMDCSTIHEPTKKEALRLLDESRLRTKEEMR